MSDTSGKLPIEHSASHSVPGGDDKGALELGEIEYVLAEPRASAMVESLRAVGYSPQTAVADLIDNCIAAGAANVWVRFWWSGTESYVAIRDDGAGMNPDELTLAMKPGTIGPLEDRKPDDLGRFGLGLKTASFSQCRRLTVASRRKGGSISFRRWDLDYVQQVDEWRLLTAPASGSEHRFQDLDGMEHGTIVLWECMDRVVGDVRADNAKAQERFVTTVRDVDDHLAMVFHRFLSGKKPRLRIWFEGGSEPKAVEPWDPFLESHPATFCTPTDEIPFAGGTIKVKGFVLPHKSKMTAAEHRAAGGPGGWNQRQGFYVYRNERLVVPGSWLGIGTDRQWTREEHYKLARIRIDIPNSMDLAWHLDVKKSDARPPAAVRERLKELALVVRGHAKRVFATRGGVVSPGKKSITPERPWEAVRIADHPTYRIVRKHPMVVQARHQADRSTRDTLDALLRLLEETVPIERIWIDTAENDEAHLTPYELAETDEVVDLARRTYDSLTGISGCSRNDALDRLAKMEPFARFPEILALVEKDL